MNKDTMDMTAINDGFSKLNTELRNLIILTFLGLCVIISMCILLVANILELKDYTHTLKSNTNTIYSKVFYLERKLDRIDKIISDNMTKAEIEAKDLHSNFNLHDFLNNNKEYSVIEDKPESLLNPIVALTFRQNKYYRSVLYNQKHPEHAVYTPVAILDNGFENRNDAIIKCKILAKKTKSRLSISETIDFNWWNTMIFIEKDGEMVPLK